jgi:hypothetical protein
MNKDNETEIRENWFKDHKAVLTKHGDLEVLDWCKPETNIFAVRYVFDGYKMYVSGDLGAAVFRFTQPVNPFCLSGYNLDYFEEKMVAFQDAHRDFNKDTARAYLNEWRKERSEEDKGFSHKTWAEARQELYNIVDDCSTIKEWEIHLNSFDVSRLGNDAWEWVSGIGDEIPMRVQSYLIGLKMAVEQLEVKV